MGSCRQFLNPLGRLARLVTDSRIVIEFVPNSEGLGWDLPEGCGDSAVSPDLLYLQDAQLGLQVAVGDAPSKPKAEDIRKVWRRREDGKGFPLMLVVRYPKAGVTTCAVCGPTGEQPKLDFDLDPQAVARVCNIALKRPNRASALSFLATAEVEEQSGLPGLRNVGLFATHELANGVPARGDWSDACTDGRPVLGTSGRELVTALGFKVADRGLDTSVLVAADEDQAVAVFLEETEAFNQPAGRFVGVSPVAHALAAADREGLAWVMMVRGSTVRLYPAKPDVGVGRRGRAGTYVEANLDLLPFEQAGYLTLLFSAEALAGESVAEILESSSIYVAGLGERLRDRIYFDAVPSLATAIAGAFGDTSAEGLRAAYQRTMTVLYRLLFVAYGEDKELLPYRTNGAYADRSLTNLAKGLTERLRAEQPFDPHVADLWDQVVELWVAIEKGHNDWDVPAYGGTLFSTYPEVNPDGAALAGIALTDAQFGPMLTALLVDVGPDGLLGPVDFRSLSVREFGTIYEGLLESELSVARSDLAEVKGNLVPAGEGDEVVVAEGEIYFHNRSGVRKSTGSYFTKPFAVEHLLRHALAPALDDHLERVRELVVAGDEAGAARALFDFRVADIAMGSGHFLVAAIDHLEARFSRFLADHPIPVVNADLDALCRAAERMLGDLADRYRIETTQVLRRLITRRCVYGVDLNPISVELARLGVWIHTFVPGLPLSFLDHNLVVGNSLTGIGTLDEVADFVEGGLAEADIRKQLGAAQPHLDRLAALGDATIDDIEAARDAADAARDSLADATRLLDMLVLARADLAELDPLMLTDEDAVARRHATAEAQEHLSALEPLHFPLTFPEVFAGTRPGFDCLLGNPPWDEMHVNADKFWVRHMPGHMSLPTDKRAAAREHYELDRPDLALDLQMERDAADYIRWVVLTGPYPGIGKGVADYYKAFGWRAVALLAPNGRLGYVFPRAAVVGASNKNWRRHLAVNGCVSHVCNLTNTRGWVFEDLEFRYPVVLFVFHEGDDNEDVEIAGRYNSMVEYGAGLSVEPLRLSIHELDWINDHRSIPSLPTAGVADIFRTFIKHPRLRDDRQDFEVSGGVDLKASEATALVRDSAGRDLDLRIIQGRDIGVLEALSPTINPSGSTSLFDDGHNQPFIAYRQIARPDDSRTMIATVCAPSFITKETSYYLLINDPSPKRLLPLAGFLGSRVFDWYVRCYVDLRILPSLITEFPVPLLIQGARGVESLRRGAAGLIAGELLLRDWVGETQPNGDSRDNLLALLDAAAAQLVGLDLEQVGRLLASFHRNWDHADHLARVKEVWSTIT